MLAFASGLAPGPVELIPIVIALPAVMDALFATSVQLVAASSIVQVTAVLLKLPAAPVLTVAIQASFPTPGAVATVHLRLLTSIVAAAVKKSSSFASVVLPA
jgi:hypothetical protein